MSRHGGLFSWTAMVSTQMPHLSQPQARVLALWSYGIAMTRSCGRLTVATFLALLLGQKVATLEQRLYEWCCEASHKAGTKRQALEVTTCFVPLLHWIVLPLDRDPTGSSPRRHHLGDAVCGARGLCRLSRVCDPRGLDDSAREPAWSVAP